MKPQKIEPDAARVIEGLRDTGYDFNTAVADVVDNSVAAEATKIELILKLDFRGKVTLRIYDNGSGMSGEELLLAMRYGSPPRPSKASLGKFGLGLKTASTAFCRRLVVVTRNGATAPLEEAVWDLDHVCDNHQWELLAGPAQNDEAALFEELLAGQRGTMVLWDKVDRLMKTYKQATGASARRAFERIVSNLRQHLSMVFQRFLDPGDKRARHFEMTLNGEPVEAWNPFVPSLSRLEGDEKIAVEMGDGEEAGFRVRAFILPRKEDFPTEEEHRDARLRNDMQGIYVYRENRLIHGPDWLGVFANEPHLTLLRVEFSFDHRLDDAFQIDIKKSRVILDESIAGFVSDFLAPRRRAANDIYRKGLRQKIAGETAGAHDSSNRNIASKEREVGKPEVKSADPASGDATLVNRAGEVRLKLKISGATRKDEIHVRVVDSIEDGLLWEPALIDGHYAVQINRGHPYYAKVYVPNLAEGVTVQGMDALLWGMSLAELNCVTDANKDMFSDLRFEVSRNLRKLVQDLPDPELPEE